MPIPNQPTQAEKRKHRYQIEIGDRVEMIHRDDPYHPGRDSNVGQVGTVTRVTDGAWGERVEFKTDDGRVISASSGVVIHAEDPTPPTPTTTQRFAIMLMGSQGAPSCMLPNGERVCLTVAGGKGPGLRSVFFYHTESEADKVLFDAHQAVINKDNWPAGYDSAGLADRIDSAVIVSMQVTA